MHKESSGAVTHAPAAANAPIGSSTPSAPVEDLSFTKFIQNLAKSGSEKGFFIQKQYAQFMEPIA
jgi:hypothetical protein